MTDQPADLLAAAAQRLRECSDLDQVAILNAPVMNAIAHLLEQEARGLAATETAAQQVWPDDPAARAAWIARQQPDHALAVARAVLGQNGDQQ